MSEGTEDKHVDEFTMVEAHMEPTDEYGNLEFVITAVNNTDEQKKLLGISLSELDADGNILDSYRSNNQNAIEAIVMPGQEVSIPLTCMSGDKMMGVQCTGYEYGEFGDGTEGTFSEVFVQMF